ncbi:MAG: DUF1573 domain-containing protein [Candidatus Omnitrophica bacterium]|nr:DUF1573 domain-containing protein [Candidatus Omnitrophota bacterium]
MKKILITLAFLILFPLPADSAEKIGKQDLVYFYSTSCDKCMRIKDEVMPLVGERFKDEIGIVYKDIGDIENYKALFEPKKKYSKDEKAEFPVLFLNGNFIDKRDLKNDDDHGKIVSFIKSSIKTAISAPAVSGKADPLEYFKTFTLPAVMLAGFVDGINPCSFTVIVFFISFLSLQRYNRKTIVLSGCAFIMASFFTYLGIGIGLFGPLYAVKGYRAAVGTINIIVGALSMALGAISFYDAFIFLKTKRPEDSILKLPNGVKNKIHKMVGDEYRARQNKGTLKIFFASLAIGFSISVLESVCTGQLYVPTIIFVLKATQYKLQALLYLLTYNMMFIIPLVAIFLLALAGVSSQGFSAIFKKYFFIIKIALAIIFLALGASLVFAEEDPPVRKISSGSKTKIISSAPKPKRQNDKSYWDFGRVKEGAVIKHKFFIENDTKDPFRIKQINTSCSCTVSTVEKDTVLPGKKVPIYVEFNTKGYPGDRTRYTYVHTDSEKTGIIVFEIRAEVVK